MRYKFRYLLAFILLWVSSAFTCGQISLEPLVRDLLVRVQALEERSAEDVVVIDSNGTAVGKLVDGLNLSAYSLASAGGPRPSQGPGKDVPQPELPDTSIVLQAQDRPRSIPQRHEFLSNFSDCKIDD